MWVETGTVTVAASPAAGDANAITAAAAVRTTKTLFMLAAACNMRGPLSLALRLTSDPFELGARRRRLNSASDLAGRPRRV
jgi:hypothetical protein